VLRVLLQPSWALRLAGSPFFAGLTAAAAAVVGLLGSVYQHEIANSFPLTPSGPWNGWSGRAVVFWAALLSLGWLVYLRQVADDSVRNRLVATTDSAEQTSRRIEDFAQTLPPAGFQAQLTRLVDRSHVWMSTGLPRTSSDAPDQLVLMIRGLLHGLATLALTYDNSPLVDGHGATYSANVMVFVPTVDMPHVPLSFLPPEYDRQQLKGILLLRQDLSATSDPPAHEQVPADLDVPILALPVPHVAERDGRWVALLGGPRAYLTGEVDGYVDTAVLAEEARRRGDFPPSVIDSLSNYFTSGPGRSIRSFVSRRLERRSGVVGVLNIHANRRDLLGPRSEKREIFHALATPLVQDLADAVGALIDASGPLPPSTSAATIGKEKTT
jgi:hypothetical protein